MFKHRYRRILGFFWRAMAGVVWWDLLLPRLGMGRLAERTRARRMSRIAAEFRTLAVRMGGVLIKVGQFLSARLDVLPREITRELAGLQDEVGAESFEAIRAVIESEFGCAIEERFGEFDRQPVASASIGQVHRAVLRSADGASSVVVKVQRPRIQEIIEVDLSALNRVGRWLRRFKTISRHMNVTALIDEFGKTLAEEVDYLHEGKNAERFAEGFRGDPEVRVPSVIWSHTTRRVLTLEEVDGIKITDYDAIDAAGISRNEVAKRLLRVYLKQVFEDGFFHADPHPGNLFVLPVGSAARATDGAEAATHGAAPPHAADEPRGESGAADAFAARAAGADAEATNRPRGGGVGWRLVFVDFGMAGLLPKDSFEGLREVLIAVGTRDASRLVSAYRKLDLLLPGADLELLERANERVFETLWGKSTKEMLHMSRSDFQRFADEFGDLLYEMPFQIPQNLILLGRCVAILSGIATGLDPNFNVWEGLAPFAEKLVRADGGSGVRAVLREVGNWAKLLFELPKRADTLLRRIDQGRLEVRMPELRQHVTRLELAVRKLGGSILFAAFFLSATALYVTGHLHVALGLGIVSAALLAWLLLGR